MSSFSKELLKTDQKIIIYGAAVYGELALRALEHIGLKPSYFADRAYAGGIYLGVEVIHPDKIINYKSDVILLASLNYYSEMCEYLDSIGVENYYDIYNLLKSDVPENALSEYAVDQKHYLERYYNVIKAGYSDDRLIIRHCEIVVTERCSLKCKDCANLMQYYDKPDNMNIEEIIVCFDRFLNAIDCLLELNILGGEPFLNAEIYKLLDKYVINEKIKLIVIYTNSTIIPDKRVIESLKDNQISVHMSDYGINRTNVEALENMLKENGIRYNIHTYDEWLDLGNLERRTYTYDEVCKVYESCTMSHCYTFYRGKFYLCPRAAHGVRLGYIKEDESVEFNSDKLDREEVRRQLRQLFKSKKYLNACYYCNGSNVHSKRILPAIQMNKK